MLWSVFVWVVMGVIVALVANSKGRSWGRWALYGFLIPIVAIVHVLVIPKTREPVEIAQDASTGPAEDEPLSEPSPFMLKNFLFAIAYLLGAGWWASQAMVDAAAGSWWNLLAFFAVLTFFLVRIGCMGGSEDDAQKMGNVFSILTAVALLVLAVMGLMGETGGIANLVFALLFAVVAGLGVRATATAHA